MTLDLGIMPWLAMTIFAILAVAKPCRATCVVMALSFAVNVYFYKDLSTLNNATASMMAIGANAITALVLMGIKKDEAIHQIIILLLFMVFDVMLTLSIIFKGNPVWDIYYSYYDHIIVALCMAMFITIGWGVANGLSSDNRTNFRRSTYRRGLLRSD